MTSIHSLKKQFFPYYNKSKNMSHLIKFELFIAQNTPLNNQPTISVLVIGSVLRTVLALSITCGAETDDPTTRHPI